MTLTLAPGIERALQTVEYELLIEREGVYLAKITGDWYCIVVHEDDWYPAWAFQAIPEGEWDVQQDTLGEVVLIHFVR